MPKNVMHMLDNLIENGSDQDIKVLAEGQRAALNILIDTVVPEIKASCDHRKDKDRKRYPIENESDRMVVIHHDYRFNSCGVSS